MLVADPRAFPFLLSSIGPQTDGQLLLKQNWFAWNNSEAPGVPLMVYSHWLSPGLGQGPGPKPGRMGCMVIRRTFHTAPEQGQGPEQKQGPGQVQGKRGHIPIFQVL